MTRSTDPSKPTEPCRSPTCAWTNFWTSRRITNGRGAALDAVRDYRLAAYPIGGNGRPGIACLLAGANHRFDQLVRQLGTAAYLHGVAHLTAEILAENTLMLAVITEQGWTDALHHDGATVHFDLEMVSHRELHPQIPEMPQDGSSCRAIRKGSL